MQLPPVAVLLTWPTPNYEDPVTRGPALVIVNSIFLSLVVLTVTARLYTRLVIKRWFGWDDVFILLALLFTIGLTAVVLLANQEYGWDRHVWDIPFPKFVPTSKIAMAAKVVFTAAATFTRLSLHCFYYRLVSDSGKLWFKWLVHLNVAYTIGIFVSFTFLSVFQCNPIRNYWTIGAPPDSCMDEGIVTLICGIINCVADFSTTITPIPLVLGLQMPRRQKLAVALLFAMGIIVTVAGIVRTWYIHRSLIGEYDQTWYAFPLWIAATVEIDLGVICASAPVLRPLLAKVPFSLSETLSRAISIKKSSSGYATNTQTASHTAPTASTSSERAPSKPQSYEMKHWADVEAGLIGNTDSERGSQEAILDENDDDAPAKKGITRIWDKLRTKPSREEVKEDMTITRTSEVELQIETASMRSDGEEEKRRRIKKFGDILDAHMPLPPGA
ncbi:hypothetical protein BDW02DRAFT_76513 [Decorospora gaudefroyi]|uniref:Rhodopsin domain-containing protein n=1 Tax=Decorospora gaudefroyi TaxID=184978 RepID=A0A6A5K922_9PLEO|nr:hypothetical protein BDW02DRAFT_76513 [Decorospora gaudefroyi]